MRVRIERMKKRPDFLATAAARRKWVAPGFVLQARQRRPDEDPPGMADNEATAKDGAAPVIRIGFTASRKVGGAVARNRAKRRLRAAADRVLPERGAPGWDLVLIARQGTGDRPFAELTTDLGRALDRLGAARRKAAGPATRPAEPREAVS
jgi:ribonuclease P protein component